MLAGWPGARVTRASTSASGTELHAAVTGETRGPHDDDVLEKAAFGGLLLDELADLLGEVGAALGDGALDDDVGDLDALSFEHVKAQLALRRAGVGGLRGSLVDVDPHLGVAALLVEV